MIWNKEISEIAKIDNNLYTNLRTFVRNATYFSKVKQNELLGYIKDPIQNQIVVDINNQIGGPYYGYQMMKWQTVPVENSLVLYFDM